MKELFESFRRGLIVCLGSAIFLITASLALSPLSEAGTDAVTHLNVLVVSDWTAI